MMEKKYIPTPIDTSDIVLPAEIERLGEMLAKNTHDNFAKMRMESGWTYGPQRNDEKKQNPTLVPYEDLTEEEKEYDRLTSSETLKVILALGYDIVKRG